MTSSIPRTDEISVAYEREMARGVKLTGTYIRRDAKNFINSTAIGADVEAIPFANPLTGQSQTIYRLASGPDRLTICGSRSATWTTSPTPGHRRQMPTAPTTARCSCCSAR